MPFTAEAEITIAAPIAAVFEAFIDYRTWSKWMAPVMRPVTGPARALRTGDRAFVLVGNALPLLLSIDRLEAPREIMWSGGIPGVLVAHHTFHFEPAANDQTHVRSVEPWTGLLTHPKGIAGALQKAAEVGGARQLKSFNRWFTGKKAS
jgi:uncharacterized protein YndB with AHSA1/START domain